MVMSGNVAPLLKLSMKSNVALAMNKYVAQSMRRFVTLFPILSMRNNVQLSMSKFATLFLSKFVGDLLVELDLGDHLVELGDLLVDLGNLLVDLGDLLVELDLNGNLDVEAEPELGVDMVPLLLPLVAKFQDRNVAMCQDNSARMFQGRCPGKSAKLFPNSNAKMFQESPAEMFQDKCKEKNARMFHPSNAQLFQDSPVRVFQGSNVPM